MRGVQSVSRHQFGGASALSEFVCTVDELYRGREALGKDSCDELAKTSG